MPPTEIIDLSIETDEEEQLPLPRPTASRKQSNALETDFVFGGNQHGRAHAEFSTEGQRKRRRLSPTLLADDDVEVMNYNHTTKRVEVNGATGSFQVSAEAAVRSQRKEKQKLALPEARVTGTADSRWHEIDDPILCTSSAHEPVDSSPSKRRTARGPSVSSDDGLIDIAELRGRTATLAPTRGLQLSARTEALLSSLAASSDLNTKLDMPRDRDFISHIANTGKRNCELQSQGKRRQRESPLRDVTEASVNVKKKKNITEAEKKARDIEREHTRAGKAEKKQQEREEEKERKQLLKEEKVREKQLAADLAEVNKARTDKKISTPEMIVDLPTSIEGESVDTQIREFLKNLQVEATTYSSPVPNIIKWRRKVTAEFNRELGHWEPIPQEIRRESHVLCLLSAKDFVDMASVNPAEVDGQDLEAHVLKVKSKYDDSTAIYLIEGLEAWMRKNKNVRNRAYQAAMLRQTDGQRAGPATAGSSKRKKPEAEYIDEDMVEDALLRLQVVHSCLIHHTAIPVETAEWISNFTQHISTIPYRYIHPLYTPLTTYITLT